MDEGKTPPCDTSLEEAVLGAILQYGGSFLLVKGILDEDAFFLESHRDIFSAMSEIDSAGGSIDMMTVTHRLRESKKLDSIGGPLYISDLMMKVASDAHIEQHAYILHSLYIKRQCIRHLGKMSRSVYDDNVEQLLQNMSESIEKILEKAYRFSGGKTWASILDKSIELAYKRSEMRKENKLIGVPTPLTKLNMITSGLVGNRLVLIAGRPGSGKTSVMLSFIKTAAESGCPVAVFSLEMDDVSLADKLICAQSGIPFERYASGHLTEDELTMASNASFDLQLLPIYIDDNPNASIEYISAKAAILKRKGMCGMVAIDYVGLVKASSDRDTREQVISNISKSCKKLAKKLDVPVLELSQLNREADKRADKRPQLSDLRESGSLEQDADMVLFVHRLEYYGFLQDDNGNSTVGLGTIIIAKNRFGQTGDVSFRYSPDLTRISDPHEEFSTKKFADDINNPYF